MSVRAFISQRLFSSMFKSPPVVLVLLYAVLLGWGLLFRMPRLVSPFIDSHSSDKGALELTVNNCDTVAGRELRIGELRLLFTRSRNLLFPKITAINGVVVKGSEGYLFYKAKQGGDGHSIDSLRGEIPFTEAQLERMINRLREQTRKVESWGGHLLTVVVPNKETMYSQFLPIRFHNGTKISRLDQFMERVSRSQEVHVLDLRPDLLAAVQAKKLPVYYNTDTHWTQWGSHVGYVAIINYVQKWFPELRRKDVSVADVDVKRSRNVRVGDIQEMIKRATGDFDSDYSDDVEPIFPQPQVVKIADVNAGAKYVAGGETDNWQHVAMISGESKEADIDKLLVVVQDSFGAFPFNYVQDHFSKCRFYWTHRIDIDEARKLKPALIVHEIVERYLERLGDD